MCLAIFGLFQLAARIVEILYELAKLEHFFVRIDRKQLLVHLEVLTREEGRIFVAEHRSYVLCQFLHIAIVVGSLDQHVLAAQFLARHVLSPLLELVRSEVVLEDLVVLEAFDFEHEFFDDQERPRIVEPADGPICVALKKGLRVRIGFFDQLALSPRKQFEMTQKERLQVIGFLRLLFLHKCAFGLDLLLGLV